MRALTKQTVVAASVADVWKTWTTVEGVKSFFAPEAKIELRQGGAYEIYFDLEQPPGLRGSEGCKILKIEPEKQLVVSWNFPPHLSIRNERTEVAVAFEAIDARHTRVKLLQTGWRQGGDWEAGYAYFDRVWGVVMERLAQRFSK